MGDLDGTDPRGIDGLTLHLMTEIRKAMEAHEKAEASEMHEIKALIKENKRDSERRHDELGKRFDAMQQSTSALLFDNNKTTTEIHKMFKAAFPDGDGEAHRKAHEAWMAKEREERAFWLKLKEDVIKWAVVAVLGWGGIALWAAFVKGPQ